MSIQSAVQRAAEGPLAHSVERLGRGVVHDIGVVWDRAARAAREVLKDTPPGKILATGMDEVREKSRMRAGLDEERVHTILHGFSKQDVEHISDVMELIDKPRTEKHRLAAERLSSILEEYSDDAMESDLRMYSGLAYQKSYDKYINSMVRDPATGAVRKRSHDEASRLASKEAQRPFMPNEAYVPHYFTERSILSYMLPGPKREAALRTIMDQGWASDKQTAGRYLERMLRQPGEFRGGPLQHTRDFALIGYEKNLRNTLPRYFASAAKRIETARKFGNKDQLAKKLIGEIGQHADSERAALANNVYLAFADNVDPRGKALARATGMVHAITLLSTAGIVQPSQMVNTIARIGWTNTIKASAEVMRDWGRQLATGHESPSAAFARSSGALLDTFRADFTLDTIDDLTSVWSKVIGLEHLDRVNRVVAAVGGRVYANELANKVISGQASKGAMKRAMKDLERLGIDPAMVIARGGLTGDEIRQAGYRISTATQFATSPLDMPELRNTPAGRFMYLFKSFAFQQMNFIKNEIIREGARGNWAPAVRYSTALPIGAYVLGTTVRKLKGKEDPESDNVRIMENMALAGAFGMFFDMWRSMASGPSAIYSFVFGPTAGETAQILGSDIPAIVKGPMEGEEPNFNPLLKHMTRRIPGVGQAIVNRWWED